MGKTAVETKYIETSADTNPRNNMPWFQLASKRKMFQAACQLPAAPRAAKYLQQEPANGLPPHPDRTAPLLAARSAKTYFSPNFRAGGEPKIKWGSYIQAVLKTLKLSGISLSSIGWYRFGLNDWHGFAKWLNITLFK